MHSHSCTCCYTRWSLLSAIDSSDERRRRRSNPTMLNSTRSSTIIISTWRTMTRRGRDVLSLTLAFAPCSLFSCNEVRNF